MKRIYNLEGLDCAHCAAKMEKKVGAIKGVSDACVNFVTQRLTLECGGELSDIDTLVQKAVNSVDQHINARLRA